MGDLRFALRLLLKSPLLSAVVVLSLGLGIGANSAIFSLLHHIVLRSLPVSEPERLVALNSPADLKSGRQSMNNAGGGEAIFSYRMFRGLEAGPKGVTGLAGFRLFGANLSYQKQTVDGSVLVVSGDYFRVLGVQPRMGRLIERADDVHGAGRPVAVLSHGYWQSRLGGDPTVLNQPLRINGRVFTIVGVTPRGFNGTTFGDQPNVFVPMCFQPAMVPTWDGTKDWTDYWVYIFARLQPGLSRAQAETALNSTYRGLVEEQANATSKEWSVPADLERFRKSRLALVDASHGRSIGRDEVRTPLLILMASTALVLLIAIANTANVLLARAAQRRREMAIRTSLGASRGRLIRQTMSEALLISSAGGVAGVLLGAWTVALLMRLMSADSSVPEEVVVTGLEWPVLLFALGLSILAGLLCGIYPAWEIARTSVSEVLKDQSGQSSGTLRAARVRKLLVCAQVTLSVLLLIPTGLFMKSLVNLMSVDLGMNTQRVITFRISPELNGYKPEQSRALFERVEQQVAAIPGVKGVAASMVPLIAGSNWGNDLTVEGFSRDPKADDNSNFNSVGPGFFGKMGVALLNGREFTERDAQGAPKVAVVNERWAKHFFGNRNPIGRHFGLGNGDKMDIEVVGVVRDSHYSSVRRTPPRVYYTPWRQSEDIGSISFYVRTAMPTDQMVPQVRKVMQSLDPDLPLEELRTLEQQIQRNIVTERIVLQLSAAFATLATLLAMLGLYGVMAYSVTRRTREFGIRIALGASRTTIRGMVFREVLLILAVGLAIGVPCALALARLTESQLFGVKSFDLTVVVTAVAALSIAALAAGYIPARRATRVSPTVALRYE